MPHACRTCSSISLSDLFISFSCGKVYCSQQKRRYSTIYSNGSRSYCSLPVVAKGISNKMATSPARCVSRKYENIELDSTCEAMYLLFTYSSMYVRIHPLTCYCQAGFNLYAWSSFVRRYQVVDASTATLSVAKYNADVSIRSLSSFGPRH
jgi:hypothetical protein